MDTPTLTLAKAPTRGDKTVIDFGMVSIPVVVFNALDDKAAKISRSRFTATGAPVKTLQVDSETGELLSKDQIVMRYVTDSEALIELTGDEIVALASMENGGYETLGTVPAASLRASTAFLGAPVYIRAQTLKVGSKTTTPYDGALGLFLQALTLADSAIVFRYGVRGSIRTVALFGDGTGAILNSLTAVRFPPPVPAGQDAANPAGFVTKALGIVQTLAVPLEAVLPDGSDIETVRAYAESKAAGDATPATLPAAVLPEPDTFADLLDLLGGV